jgi:geranylgeranyl reductase
LHILHVKIRFYEELAEMYVGDDVSPDFYGWVFPKYDHVGVGTGTVINRPAIQVLVVRNQRSEAFTWSRRNIKRV